MKADLSQSNSPKKDKARTSGKRQVQVYRSKTDDGDSAGTSHCACGGSCPKCRISEKKIQAKMNISQPFDPLEREADTVANHVVNHNPASGKMDSDKISATPKIQRKADTNNASASIPASALKTLNSPGQKLNQATRSKMESHLGADFGNVKIHTGASAAESSADINAKAYTLGNDVVFNKGQYSPGTKEGDRLIAHELTHVVQQSGNIGRSILQRDELDAPVALDEEYEEDEDEGSETEEEDEAEDGDTDVSDVVDYPELPDLPDDIEEDPVPMPTEPEADELTVPKAIASSDNAEEMKGAKSRKIKSILVDQPTQQMTITFTSGSPKKHSISTGRGECGTKGDPCKSQNSHNCTPNGTFTIVSQGTKDTKNPKGDAMAWFVGLKVPGRKGIGIHNSQPVPGTPRSHGCVRTGNAAQDGGVAEMINKGVTYGKTKVTIQGKAATKAYACPKKKKGDKKKQKKKK